jgi:hypothetical protein
VIGVELLLQRLAVALHSVRVGVERTDGDPVAVGVEVVLIALEAVDVGHAVEAQVAEHVVEGAVLHHHHDDVLDAAQLLESVVGCHG